MTIPEPTYIPPPRTLEGQRRDGRPHAQPVHDKPRVEPPFTSYQFVAVLIWCGAWYTTWLFLVWLGANVWWSVPGAFVLQYVFTLLERPWYAKRRNTLSFGIVCADSAINALGLLPYLVNIDQLPAWQMFASSFDLEPRISIVVAALLSLWLGWILAAAPERVWRW